MVYMNMVIIANIICLIGGTCNILATQGKNKKQIISIERIGSLFTMIGIGIQKSWSDVIGKIIKIYTQSLAIKNKLKKNNIYLIIFIYIFLCLTITYILKDIRYLIAIIPSTIEFYSYIGRSTKKYRRRIIITKIFWTINNIIFKLYIGIFFDIIVIIGHLSKINKKKR